MQPPPYGAHGAAGAGSADAAHHGGNPAAIERQPEQVPRGEYECGDPNCEEDALTDELF
jgi:hypothetical protein